jgi:hypothetical protein
MVVEFEFDFADACVCADDTTWRNHCDAKAVEAVGHGYCHLVAGRAQKWMRRKSSKDMPYK